ncbi:hypothetical protein Tco_0767662 [Tanacetum coccineum]
MHHEFRHYDTRNVGSFVVTEDNKADLFPLQISLSIFGATTSLIVRISQKVHGYSPDIVRFTDDQYLACIMHYDTRNIGSFVATEDNKAYLFPLQVSMLISGATTSLIVRISQKGNRIGTFKKSYQIFSVNSGVLKIRDFSGQTTKFFLQGNMICDKPEQVNAEVVTPGFASKE